MYPQGNLVYGMENEGLLLRSCLRLSWRKILWGISLVLHIRNALGDLSLGIDSWASGPAWGMPTFLGFVHMLGLTGYTETTAQRIADFSFRGEGVSGSGTQSC